MAKKAAASAGELVPREPQTDLDFVQQVGATVIEFLKQAREFFEHANRLERRALDLLAEAKALKLPTNAEEDQAIQLKAQNYNKGKAIIEDKWSTITTALFRLHRRATGKRDVGVKALAEASEIANRLHNEYDDAARRRAAVQEEQLRREALKREEDQRQRELDDLEKAALKAEASSKDLSEREEKFVTAVAVNYDPVVAAREVGYADPSKQAERLMKTKKIVSAIAARKKANAAREQAEALRQAPLEQPDIEVKPDVAKAAGTTSRTTWRAEVVDAELFLSAVFDGRIGIPRDTLMPNEAKLNEYARELHHLINRWPGVRAVKKTQVV